MGVDAGLSALADRAGVKTHLQAKKTHLYWGTRVTDYFHVKHAQLQPGDVIQPGSYGESLRCFNIHNFNTDVKIARSFF